MDDIVRIILKARNNILLSKREELGFSQAEMAKYCDVDFNTYCEAERLNYRYHGIVKEKKFRKIAEVLEIDFDKLFPQWASFVGEIINSPKVYLLLDDEYAQQKILPMNEFGGSQRLLKESFANDLEESMKRLTKRQAEVIKHYFGVCNFEQMSIDKIAAKYKLSSERVRQIKEKALRRLRYDSVKEILEPYLNESFEN